MKECDILRGGVKTYSDPSYILLGGVRTPNPRIYSTPLVMTTSKQETAICSGRKTTVVRPRCPEKQCFIQTRKHWGNEDCWERLPNEARRAENRDRKPRAGVGFLR